VEQVLRRGAEDDRERYWDERGGRGDSGSLGAWTGTTGTVYEVTLAREFEMSGLTVDRQVPVAITYKGIKFVEGFRADLIVAGKVIV